MDEGYDDRRITVIRNGIDPAPFGRKGTSGKLHHELGLPPHAPLVAVLSRVSPIKGLEYFLEAATMVAARVPDARFLIVGKAEPSDAEYRRGLEAYAARLGLGRRVVFTGLRMDVPECWTRSSVSALPRSARASPTCSSSRWRPACPSSPRAWAATPRSWRTASPGSSSRRAMPPGSPARSPRARGPRGGAASGTAGRARVVEHFSIDDMVRQTEQLYETLLRRRGHDLES